MPGFSEMEKHFSDFNNTDRDFLDRIIDIKDRFDEKVKAAVQNDIEQYIERGRAIISNLSQAALANNTCVKLKVGRMPTKFKNYYEAIKLTDGVTSFIIDKDTLCKYMSVADPMNIQAIDVPGTIRIQGRLRTISDSGDDIVVNLDRWLDHSESRLKQYSIMNGLEYQKGYALQTYNNYFYKLSEFSDVSNIRMILSMKKLGGM